MEHNFIWVRVCVCPCPCGCNQFDSFIFCFLERHWTIYQLMEFISSQHVIRLLFVTMLTTTTKKGTAQIIIIEAATRRRRRNQRPFVVNRLVKYTIDPWLLLWHLLFVFFWKAVFFLRLATVFRMLIVLMLFRLIQYMCVCLRVSSALF